MSHVHCESCHKAIEANKNKPFKVATVLAPAPSPKGITFFKRTVPVCEACAKAADEHIREMEDQHKQEAVSKLIVPGNSKPKLVVPE